jgi:membrane protein DedA with SNARE-associated domain/membrane-associated phospholipid phosphatase
MGNWLVVAFDRFGYAVVLVGIFFESVGIPLPGETVLLAGGFFARQGSLQLWKVIVFAIIAAVLGDNTGYWIGRRAGRGLLERHGRKVGITPERLQVVEQFFARHGSRTVLFARFISGVRVLAAITAGIAGIKWRRFALFEACGAVLWSIAVAAAGYWFGASWHVIGRWIGRAGLFAIAVAVLALLLRLARRQGQAWTAGSWLPRTATARQLWFIAAQLLAVGVLVRIGRAVSRHHLSTLDAAVGDLVARVQAAWVDRLGAILGLPGWLPVLVAVLIALTIWLTRQGDRRGILAVVIALSLSLLFCADISVVLNAVRGLPGGELLALFDAGFPSMPTMASVALYGTAAYLIGRRSRPLRRIPAVIAGGVVLGVGFSRLLAGQWVSDVLAGYAAGGIILLVIVFELERFETTSVATVPPTLPAPASPNH